MTTEFISHPLCPFKQRLILSRIRLGQRRGEDFDVVDVDLGHLPLWFLHLSPDRNMPIILESEAPPSFDVDAELRTALQRHEGRDLSAEEQTAIEQTDALLTQLRDVFMAGTVEAVEDAVNVFFDGLSRVPIDEAALERVLHNRGDLREVTLAPLFSLVFANPGLSDHPRLRAMGLTREYGQSLAQHPDTLASRCPNYAGEFQHFFHIFGAAYPQWEAATHTS